MSSIRARLARLERRLPRGAALPTDPAALLALAREQAAYYGQFFHEPGDVAAWAGLLAELDAGDVDAARVFLRDVADVTGKGVRG